MPDWAGEKSQQRIGNTYIVVCGSEAPSADLARREALQSCRNSASSQLNTSFSMNRLTVETETSSVLHQEIIENSKFTGLDCITENESIEEKSSSVKIWLKCRFDLSKARAVSLTGDTPTIDIVRRPTSLGSGDARSVQYEKNDLKAQRGDHILGSRRILSIASIPACDTLLIRGQVVRAVKCVGNPMSIVVGPDDREVVVRAENSFPKSILLNQKGLANETIQIVLDSN